MPRITADDPGVVIACPECDVGGQVYRREGHCNAHVGDPDDDYSCGKCGATFNEPVERAPKVPTDGGRGPDLDPREVLSDAD